MKTGRPPKPTALKELAGNPGKRPLNRNEPKPKVMAPSCPTWIAGEARAEYKRVARILTETRVMTEADRTALAAYAHSFGEWRHAENMVSLEGAVVRSEKGGLYLNPWQGIAANHFKNMVGLMREFGLTPSSRTRIEAQPEEVKKLTLAEQLFASVGND